MFGGTPGPLRLLNSALGGQAGWLLGFALLSGVGILLATRLRRSDARTGWLLVVGGSLVTTAVLFSAASGIFHPYYVSLLAPFIAAFAGAGIVGLTRRGVGARILAAPAVAAGVTTELVVRADYSGQLTWLPPVLIALGGLTALALLTLTSPRARLLAAGAAVAALLIAPSAWAVDTLGYATSSTFPAGGPASAENGGGGPFGGPGGFGRGGRAGPGTLAGGGGGVQLFGAGASSRAGAGQPPSEAGQSSGEGFGAGQAGGPPSGTGNAPGAGAGGPPGAGATSSSQAGALPGAGGSGSGAGRAGGFTGGGTGGGFGGGFGGAPGAGGGFGGDASIDSVLSYVKSHGGGTIAVSSQSSAAQAIIATGADVAGIGGFSGRESDVSASWLAQEVRAGKIRWVLAEAGAGQGGPGLPGDTRVGAKTAMVAVAKACERVTLPSAGASGASETSGGGTGAEATLYDCQGRSTALAGA
jgi:hypothetical protein